MIATAPPFEIGPTGSVTDVVIVGGGLAGIAAAVRLADRGRAVRLLERRTRLGGQASSLDHTGLVADTGQHVFLRCYHQYRALLDRMGVSDLVELQDRLDISVLLPGGRRARLRRGRLPAPWHVLPSLARYAGLPPTDRARALIAGEALRRVDPDNPASDQQTFGGWLREHHQSARAIRRLWGLIAVAALNLHPDRASLALAARVFQTGLFDGRSNGDIGMARVPLNDLHAASAARLLDRLGVAVTTRSHVQGIEPADEGFILRTSRGDLLSKQVLVATPHGPASQLMPPGAWTGSERWADLGSSAIVNCHFVVDRPVLDVPFAAAPDATMQWIFDRTQTVALDHGQYLVTSVSDADQLTVIPGRRLCRQQWDELQSLLPAAGQAHIVDSFVTREPRATFCQRAGTATLRPATATLLPGLALAGAWTATGWPDTMEGAVRSGQAAADVLTVEHQQRDPVRHNRASRAVAADRQPPNRIVAGGSPW
jgi:squalene-associated FAD-dependent desaturase